MLILQATNVLGQLNWTAQALLTHNQMQERQLDRQIFLARYADDVSSSLCAWTIADQVYELANLVEQKIGPQGECWWHDLI